MRSSGRSCGAIARRSAAFEYLADFVPAIFLFAFFDVVLAQVIQCPFLGGDCFLSDLFQIVEVCDFLQNRRTLRFGLLRLGFQGGNLGLHGLDPFLGALGSGR